MALSSCPRLNLLRRPSRWLALAAVFLLLALSAPRVLAQSVSSWDLDMANRHATGSTVTSTGNVLVVDEDDDQVYGYSSTGGRSSDLDFDLDALNDLPRGLAVTPAGNVLVVDSTDDKVYGHSSTGGRSSGLDFDLDALNANASGLAVTPAGNVLVVDSTDDKVYGYSSTGGRSSGLDFDLDALNADASGLAVTPAGNVLVVDSDNKVYGYSSTGGRSSGLDFDLDALNADASGLAVTPAGNVLVVDKAERIVFNYSIASVASSLTERPDAADMVTVSRSSDYETATFTWDVPADIITEYEIERREALTVSVGILSRIEYGNLKRFVIDGTLTGVVEEYEDNTVRASRTYQYRVRLQGGEDLWSSWSDYAFSGEKPGVDIEAPTNVQVARNAANDEVTVTWTAPDGELDNYTVQRQELFKDGGSTFFANTSTLGGASWLPTSSTSYTDSMIFPARSYEYRVAAVKDDLVGEYSDWFRTVPANLEYGEPPANLRLHDSTARDDRREYWLAWDEVDGTTDYELERLILSPDGRQTVTPGIIVTEPMYFQTGYTLNRWRVRGRKSDADLCGSGTDDYCYTGWTGWFQVGFQPLHKVETPAEATESTRSTAVQAEVDEFHSSVVSFVEDTMSISGVTVDGQGILNTGVMVAGVIPAGIATWRGRRTGMIGIGMGSGVAYFVMTLALGVRLLELPVSWIIVSVMVVLVGGGLAAVKVLGLFGRGS